MSKQNPIEVLEQEVQNKKQEILKQEGEIQTLEKAIKLLRGSTKKIPSHPKAASTGLGRGKGLRAKSFTRDHFREVRQHILDMGKTTEQFTWVGAHNCLKKTIYKNIKKEQVVGQLKYMAETSKELLVVAKGERLGATSVYSLRK